MQGIVVKCHQSRLLHQNRELARKLLQDKLDELINGENSVVNQKKEFALRLFGLKQKRAEKLRQLKAAFKAREDLAHIQSEKEKNKNDIFNERTD